VSAIGIGLLILAHTADYVTFMAMVARHGIDAELNPLVATIAQEHGLLLLTLAKTSAVLLVASTFLVVVRTRPRVAGGMLIIGVLLGGVGAWSNIVSF
jgi:hypothetical protein